MRKFPYVVILAAVVLAACGEETRNGELSLSGSAPLRLVDESGKTVEFAAGPTKVVLGSGGSNKFTVTVSQGAKQAKFSGKAPSSDGSWNFKLSGKDIGQPVDIASTRDLQYVGAPWTQMRDGGPCGFNGRMLVEDRFQKCNEDWRVSFAAAAGGAAVGEFSSRQDGQTCLLDSRDVYCRDNGPYPPYPPYPRRFERMQDSVKNLQDLTESGLNFD